MTTTWRYPSAFWIANGIELFERAAYYGTFIALVVFLTSVVGFTDVEAGWIGAGFAGTIYFLPFLVGALSDRMGFRPALALAFALLALGYGGLWAFPTRGAVLVSLFLAAAGGAFVKPIITGTVSRYSDAVNRARAFSLFYMVVNIGSFSGKLVAGPVRKTLGVGAVPLYSAGAAAIALVIVLLFYFPREDRSATPASVRETFRNLAAVLTHARLMALILIVAGFWLIQGQLYASMPKYVLRTVGGDATPEWYANVNPLVVVLCVVPVTQLIRRLSPLAAMGIALGLIPFSALAMALSPLLGAEVSLLGAAVHPITLMMVLGIALQGLAECFLSPRYLEFFSKQAPAGQEGMYLGFAHLHTFFAWVAGFILSGYLLEAFCPDPATLSAAEQAAHQAALAGQGAMPAAYARAHYIWYVFAGIGAAAFLALQVFRVVIEKREGRSPSR